VLRADGTRRAFLSGPLRLKPGVTLVVDSGAIVFGSRDPKVYELSPGSCGVLAPNGHGCRPLITVDRASHAGVMGPGTIDGRGWATLLGQNVSWWDLAQQARNSKLTQNCPRIIVATQANDFTLYRLTLRNSPNFHVWYDRGDGFTAWGVVIYTPQKNARNTDGIDPSASRNVTITRSYILAGDDNVALKGGNGPMSHMTVSHSHFYRGHGMSIGSETNAGVDHLYVTDLSIDGADNGLRIKSNAARGGLVTNVTY
jgi:polygalacturonase